MIPLPRPRIVARVVVVGEARFFLCWQPSLEKAISGKASVPCVTALDVQMESPGRITLPASSFAVWLGLHHLQTVHHLVSCQREHPVLLFYLILIHDGSNSRVVRQHLG